MNYPDILTVYVNNNHIYEGEPKSTSSCPLALAIDEATGQEYSFVYEDEAEINTIKGEQINYMLSRRARKFVHDFDRFLPIEPITFRLRKKESQ